MYCYWEEQLPALYDVCHSFKQAENGEQIRLLRSRSRADLYLVERRFPGSAGVWRQLLDVNCPWLPRVLEVMESNGRSIVLEEYVQGDLLSDLIEDSLLNPRRARSIATDLCRALYVLHGRGIVHRDVKPENVLLRGDHAVLLDLNAARLENPSRPSDTVALGTIGYAAPEQYGLSQTDARADIYALGVTLNRMLTGEHPSIRLARGSLGRIISRCTAVNPGKRYRDVRRLMELLGA